MKSILLIQLLLVAAIVGCRDFAPDRVREFIPGTYIRYSEHEFGHECDTLVITIQNASANEFSILRKWKYERVLDGVLIEPEYKRTITTGIYNEKLLKETESGDVYSFDVNDGILFSGTLKYQKAP